MTVSPPWIAHDWRAARRRGPTALAIGNFDGVHLGHRALLDKVIHAARAFGGESVARTFEPHPTRVVRPDRAPPMLTGLDRRVELLSETGVDAVVVQRFDLAMAALSPEEFVRRVVVGLGAREVHVGADFHFGHDRAGTPDTLRALGVSLGFTAHTVEGVREGEANISSSRVRAALSDGDLGLAARLLGRPFDLDGVVVHGDHRGRTLGFPTANLATPCEAPPRDGVYAVRAQTLSPDGAGPWRDGVMNIGSRPTMNAGRSLEAHLLDLDEDLYGRTLRVRFVARLRDEQRFASIEELRRQIERDVASARAALSSETPA
ncbi:MAG: bifunctional riboflavin kinase/FAD synthetase [Polyangiales bacterium]